ncbi:MAG: tetratricopeptide repeat protein [Bryobacteraceae bacterium]
MRIRIRVPSIAGLAIGLAIPLQVVWAQRAGGPPGGSIGGTGSGHLPPSTMNGQPQGPAPASLNGNIYLTGNVLLDDGTPPPDPVTIERVCTGTPRAQAYTDRKGRFSFQIGQNTGVMQDASEASGVPGASHTSASLGTGVGPQQPQQPDAPDLQLANCDLRAVLSGFRSDSVPLGARRLLDDPNVGTIVLHRLAGVEGTAISVTSLQAPKEARRSYEKALQDMQKNKSAEAGKELQKAVEIYPNYAAAWYALGQIQEQDKDLPQARQSLQKAMAADPKFISPYIRLSELEARAENWGELVSATDKLLKLDAVDYPKAYLYNATGNLNLGHLEDAEKSALAGEKLDTAHRLPRLEQVLATIRAREKDYAGAAAHLRSYLVLAPNAEDAARMKKELAELERLAGTNQQAKAAGGS